MDRFIFKNIYPIQISNSRWKMSPEAIENTMSYVYDKLRHPCYLVGIKNHRVYFYKLRPSGGTPKELIPILQENIRTLGKNPLITDEQIMAIKKGIDVKETRIMQCIVKSFVENTSETVNEYYTFLKTIENKLENGVFLFNLTDANILRKDGAEPFPFVYGIKPMTEIPYVYGDFLPIMGGGQTEYMDIPIPNYDEIIRIVEHKFIDPALLYQLNWNKKREKAIFRGGPSGCGASSETNMRLLLSELSRKSPKYSKWVDSCIIGRGERVIKYDPVYGLSKINNDDMKQALCSDQKGVPMTIQSTYKYIIHVDGNVNAYRLLNTMLTGSLILRVKSPYLHWADHFLKAGTHYIEVSHDLSNLLEVIQWCIHHDSECEMIAKTALKTASILMSTEFIKTVFIGYMNYLSEKLNKPLNNTTLVSSSVSLDIDNMSSKDIIPMPMSNRCPNGYGRMKQGDKMVCKKKETFIDRYYEPKELKPIEVLISEKTVDDYLPWIKGKKCPNGYNVKTIQSRKICKKNGVALTRKKGGKSKEGSIAIPLIEKENLKAIRTKQLAIQLAMEFL